MLGWRRARKSRTLFVLNCGQCAFYVTILFLSLALLETENVVFKVLCCETEHIFFAQHI